MNGIPYLGKTGHPKNESSGEFFFKKVTEPIHGTHRSITCDNWFTTIPLIENMLNEPYNMTITGTIRKNKPDIPNEMKIASKEAPSTKFCHHEYITLASYTPKKHKIVLVVSTKITNTNIGEDGKPEVILHYNQTKGGTDVFDKLCHAYTTARATKRWPMRFFFGMLDQSSVNARILYTCKHVSHSNEKLSATKALKQLVFHLVEPFLREKLQNPTLRTDIRKGIEMILGIRIPQPGDSRTVMEKRTRCGLCDYKVDRKTKMLCQSCQRPMCDEHRAYVCNDCVGYD